MSDVEMQEVADGDKGFDFSARALAVEWVKLVNVDEANAAERLHSLLMKHFGKHILSCFEIRETPTLKGFMAEEKFRTEILEPMAYFLCGEDPSKGFEKMKNLNNPPQLCGKLFRVGEPTYSCRDCGYDGTCVLCIDCFQKSIHKNHRYRMNTSGGGGFCDCGDNEAWKEGEACEIHAQGANPDLEENPWDKLDPHVQQHSMLLYTVLIEHCVTMVKWDHREQLPTDLGINCFEDIFVTMLFNDEVHTYDEVMRTLQQALPNCDSALALAYANVVDREGRSPVCTGSYSRCEQSREIIMVGTSQTGRKPLSCKVVHQKVLALQVSALSILGWLSEITAKSDGLRRLLCNIVVEPRPSQGGKNLLDEVLLADATLWKAARTHTHKLFMNTMLLDPIGKKWFACHFTKNYQQIQKDFIVDDHEHFISVTSLSVQIFTVPTVARMLILEESVLEVILSAFINELQLVINEGRGTLEFQRYNVPFRRAQYMLIDLSYILLHKPSSSDWTEDLRAKFIRFLQDFFKFLKLMQGMDSTTRKTGRHIETEPDWEQAFHLQFRLNPILSLITEWCTTDTLIYRTSVLEAIQTLQDVGKKEKDKTVMKTREVFGREYKLLQYDVSCQPVSIHLPASRFLSGLLLACDQFNLSFIELFGFGSEDYRHNPFLVEYPLRALAMVAQVHAGMWRRNGYAIINQVYHYQNVKYRGEMYDKDIILLQAAAAFMDADYFLVCLLDKFGLVKWSMPDFDDSRIDQDKLSQKMTVAEGFLHLVIAVVGERYVPGVGKVTADEFMRREILHKLAIKPMAHSELVKLLPIVDGAISHFQAELENKKGVDGIIHSIANFREPGMTGRGLYELKPECYKEYNPFFYHYSRIEQSKAEEQQRKRAKKDCNSSVYGPPLPPEFSKPFARVLNVLCCKSLIKLMNRVLTRAASGTSKSWSDIQIMEIFHLIGLALLEEKRNREKGTSREFDFIGPSTEQSGRGSLLKTLEGLLDNQHFREHAAQLEWIVKTFHEEIALKQNKDIADAGKNRPKRKEGKSHLEDEKARKARIAQERRDKIMAQMSAMQKAFISGHADLLREMDVETDEMEDVSNLVEALHDQEPAAVGRNRSLTNDKKSRLSLEPCILCQEQQDIGTNGRTVVMAAFVQKSTVLSKSRGKMFEKGDDFDPLYPAADQYWGVHCSSCGHMMHSDCWQGFFDSVVAKERRAVRLRQFVSVDVGRREFLCPLCGCISNTVLPILPLISGLVVDGERPTEDYNLPSFLNSLQFLMDANQAFMSVDDKNDKYGKRKNGRRVDVSVPERFVELFQAMLKSGSKFSGNLKEMIKVFSQSSFTVGLNVEPNEDDKRVPIMVWTACAYTIQSGESALRAEGKTLFDGLTSRQAQSIASLTRVAAVVASIAQPNHVKHNCVRLLSVLFQDPSPGLQIPSLLELDLFAFMVKLRLSLPSLLYQEENISTPGGSSNRLDLDSHAFLDWCSFEVVFLAHLVEVLLRSPADLHSPTESEMEQQYPEHQEAVGMATVWGYVRHCAGELTLAPHPSPWYLLQHVKSCLLPFLRCSALFFHFMTEVPGPSALKESTRPSLQVEFECLRHYLGLPALLTELLTWDPTKQVVESPVVLQCISRWCSHEYIRNALSSETAEQLACSLTPNRLLEIPRDYSELINKASMFTCPNSDGDDSRSPALCLICGQMQCSQSYCCQTLVEGEKIGACAAHACKCGAGIGVFLRVRECQILLMANKNKGCYYAPPYLDAYGETDQFLRRGNPLFLCEERYKKLQCLWRTHAITEEVTHCLESNRNLLSIDWTHL